MKSSKNAMGYLERVKTNETQTLVIVENGAAEISPVVNNGGGLLPYALCAGEFRVPDDFDAPLPDEIIEQFQSICR